MKGMDKYLKGILEGMAKAEYRERDMALESKNRGNKFGYGLHFGRAETLADQVRRLTPIFLRVVHMKPMEETVKEVLEK